jgi:hypothetical protein
MIQKRIHFEARRTDVLYIYNNSGILENNIDTMRLAYNLLYEGITNYHFRSESLIKANRSKGRDAKPLA